MTAARANGYDVLIIADHGNADNAVNGDGTPNTAHSLNPVPCIWVTDRLDKSLRAGVLADVAPTILDIMGVAQPADMTGKSLINELQTEHRVRCSIYYRLKSEISFKSRWRSCVSM